MKIGKKLQSWKKLLAALATGFLLFGTVSCGGGDDDDVDVKSVQIGSESKTLSIGQTTTLTATVLPDNATNKKIEWSSDNSEVATVDASSGVVTAIAKGTATITAKSKSNKNATATCTIKVVEALAYDGTIRFNFDSAPTLKTGGQVVIKQGGTEVDTIKTADEKYYTINNSKGAIGAINVKDQLIVVEGNDLVIVTHTDEEGYALLEPSTEYTVDLSGLIDGETTKTFTTPASPTIDGNAISVGTDGDFTTIQGALNYLRKTEATGDWTITVAAGKYHERLAYYGSANVTLVGAEDDNFGSKTVVDWKNNQNWGNSGQRARANFVWAGGNLTIKNMKFENTTNRTEEGNTNVQAETLNFDVAKDLVVYNSSFYSYQDTLILGNNGGRAWFYKSKIAGDVDFIWGTANVALFEDCKIICRADDIKNDAKVFASRTVATNDTVGKGFVLLNCDIEIESSESKKMTAAYGRSSGADTQASVIKCKITESENGKLDSDLWGSPSDTIIYEANGEMAVGYKDYGNTIGESDVDTSTRLAKTADMSERIVNREYSGRWVIFNRVYNRKTGAYEFASDIYDINTIAATYSAREDTSIDNIFVEPVYTKSIVGGLSQTLTIDTKATGLTYTYATSDKSLATVADGVVSTIAGANGTVKITVTANNGKKDEVSLVVFPTYVYVEGVSVSATESVNMYALGKATATVTPAEAIDQSLTWTATGDLRIVDPDNKVLVTSLTTKSNSVQFESTVSGGTGTIKASAADTESKTPAEGSATVSVTKVRDYNADEAVAVNSKDKDSAFGILNFQSGKVGMWHDLYVHAIYDSTNGKIAASGELVQTRYGTIYIPVSANCYIDIACKAKDDETNFVDDFEDLAGNKPVTSTGEEETYKYHYKWELDVTNDTAKLKSGADVLALYNAATKDTSRSWVDHAPDAKAKYFGIVIPGADRYWAHITVTEDSTIAHQAASATLEANDFDAQTVTIDLSDSGEHTVTKTITATSSDDAIPNITYASNAETVATVDASTGKVTAKGLVGTAKITATVSHPTDENVTKVTKSYTVKVKQTTATESMYFDFRGTGVVTDTTNAETFDYGVISGSAKYHGATYGLTGNPSLSLKVVGPSRIYFAQMDYGSEFTVKNGETEIGKATTLNSGSKKCTKTELSEAISEGYVAFVTYTGTDAATLSITGKEYLSRFWVTKYEEPNVTITPTAFTTASKDFDLSATEKTFTQTTTATASNSSTVTIKYTSTVPAVATVNETSGLVTAVGIGKTEIKAICSATGAEDAEVKYTVNVKQTSPSESMDFDFRTNGISANVDYGVLNVSGGSYHGTRYGLQNVSGRTVTLKVKSGSIIYIGKENYGSITFFV